MHACKARARLAQYPYTWSLLAEAPRRASCSGAHHKPLAAHLVELVRAEGSQDSASCGARRRATRQHASRRVLGAAGGAVFERTSPHIVVLECPSHMCFSTFYFTTHMKSCGDTQCAFSSRKRDTLVPPVPKLIMRVISRGEGVEASQGGRGG